MQYSVYKHSKVLKCRCPLATYAGQKRQKEYEEEGLTQAPAAKFTCAYAYTHTRRAGRKENVADSKSGSSSSRR